MRKATAILVIIPMLVLAQVDKKVDFRGNKSISEKELEEAVGIVKPPLYKFWLYFKKRTVDPKLIPIIKESVREFYRTKGFYNASVDIQESNDTAIFLITENDPVRVNQIEIQSDFPIKKLVPLKKGDIFDAQIFVESKSLIKRRLMESGFCSYDFDAKAYVDIKTNQANLIFRLTKGEPCTIKKIVIEGAETIKPSIIADHLEFKENERFDIRKIEKSFERLLSMEGFSRVYIDHSYKEQNQITAKVQVTERPKQRILKGGIGYETGEGYRGVATWRHRNFMGDLRKLQFEAKYSPKEQSLTNCFVQPSFLDLDFKDIGVLDFKHGVGYLKKEYESFDEESIFEKLHLLRQKMVYDLDFGLSFEQNRVSTPTYDPELTEGNFFIVAPFVGIIQDRRDSKLDPKNGYLLSHYIEFSTTYLGSEIGYAKFVEEARAIKTIGQTTLAAKAKIGFINDLEEKLPVSKRFFAGGPFSNRAYGTDKLSPVNEKGSLIGARTLIDTSLEAIHPFYENIDGALFFDTTLIGSQSFDYNEELHNSVGFGVRYNSPVGPIRIDMGFDINNFSQNAIHFIIGQSF